MFCERAPVAREARAAEIQAIMPAPAFADSDPPLWEGLGTVSYKITTAVPEAQSYFDQGLRLAFAFNHGQAQRAFPKAQRPHPGFATRFWADAPVLGPNSHPP